MSKQSMQGGSVAAALCLAILCGCAAVSERVYEKLVPQRPAELAAYYGYSPVTAPPVMKGVKDRRTFLIRTVELIPPPGAAPTNRPIQLLWFEPKTTVPAPLVLIAPISGSNTLFVDGFAQMFAQNGWHAAIIKRWPINFDPNGPITQVEDYLRAAIIRHRQALDWLLDQPNVDTNRVASFGISYGAIVNAATAGVDDRLRVNVFALAGGPIADVIETSQERSLRRYWEQMRVAHHLTDDELNRELRRTIVSDPVKLARYLDRENVLMVIALFDRSVGAGNSLRLWRAMGKPAVAFVPFGHYSAILAMPNLRYTVNHYLREKLEPVSGGGNQGYLYRRP